MRSRVIPSRRRRLLPLALPLLLPLLGAAHVSAAVTDTWTGAGSTVKWSDPANWSLAAPPGSGDTVVFPVRNPPLPAPASVDDLPGLSLAQLQVSGEYQFSTANGASLTMTGDLKLGDSSQTSDPIPPFAIPIQSSLNPFRIYAYSYEPFPLGSNVSDQGGSVELDSGMLTCGQAAPCSRR